MYAPFMIEGTRVRVDVLADVLACDSCGETAAPDGTCLNVGGCLDADAIATRGASRQTEKYAVPAAWSSSGRVD